MRVINHAAGLKDCEALGLLRDKSGKWKIDSEDPVRRCGELGLPVSIHVAEPRAFWLHLCRSTLTTTSSRPERSPAVEVRPPRNIRRACLLKRVSPRHRRHRLTTYALRASPTTARIDWVDAALDNPNMMADLPRHSEIGPADAGIAKHQDAFVRATWFTVADPRLHVKGR